MQRNVQRIERLEVPENDVLYVPAVLAVAVCQQKLSLLTSDTNNIVYPRTPSII